MCNSQWVVDGAPLINAQGSRASEPPPGHRPRRGSVDAIVPSILKAFAAGASKVSVAHPFLDLPKISASSRLGRTGSMDSTVYVSLLFRYCSDSVDRLGAICDPHNIYRGTMK